MSEKNAVEIAQKLESFYHESVSNERREKPIPPRKDIVEEDSIGEEPASEAVDKIENVPGFDKSLFLQEPPAPPSLDAEIESTPTSLQAEKHLVDAAYAEFPKEVMIPKVIIGGDDRVPVQNTKAFPWCSICHLLIESARGSRFVGTGWFCGPHTLITAGHCVYMHNQGGWVRHIKISPGRRGWRYPYGSAFSASFRSVRGWIQKKGKKYDYGAIILPEDTLGNRVGQFGFSCLTDDTLDNMLVNLSGYPSDKSGTQWYHANRIISTSDSKVYYQIDTFGGQSGSPVWREHNGHRHVVAIHTTGHRWSNSGLRIINYVFDNLRAWKR